MAITPKQILDTAVGLGRGAVNAGLGLLRSNQRAAPPTTPATPVARPAKPSPRVRPSGSPSTVGAAKPGASRGPKSATAPKARKTDAVRTKAPAAKPSRATKTAAAAAKTPAVPKARPKAQPADASRKAGATNTPS
jgi:hypothetical protein